MGHIHETYTKLRSRARAAVAEGDEWSARTCTIFDERTGDVYALSVYVAAGVSKYGVASNFGDTEWYTRRLEAADRFFEMRAANAEAWGAWEVAS